MDQDKISPTRLMTPARVFEVYGEPFSPSWLERRRADGGGPVYLKTGRGRTARVFYRAVDVEAWIEASVRRSTAA